MLLVGAYSSSGSPSSGHSSKGAAYTSSGFSLSRPSSGGAAYSSSGSFIVW